MACHPSVQPRGPQRRWGDEPLQARLEAADAAPEEGGQAAAEVAGLPVRGFFLKQQSWLAVDLPKERLGGDRPWPGQRRAHGRIASSCSRRLTSIARPAAAGCATATITGAR